MNDYNSRCFINIRYKNIASRDKKKRKGVWILLKVCREKHHPGWGGMGEPALSYSRTPFLCLRGAWLILSGAIHWAAAHIQHASGSVPFRNTLSTSQDHRVMLGPSKCKAQAATPANQVTPLSVYQQAYLDLCLSGLDVSCPFPKCCGTINCVKQHYLMKVCVRRGKKGRAVIIWLTLSISYPAYFKRVISVLGSRKGFSRGAWVILAPHF